MRITLLSLLALFTSSAYSNAYDEISVPDKVKTRYGNYNLSYGVPDNESIEKAYEFVDFSRATESFLRGIPAASLHSLYKGFLKAVKNDENGITIAEDLLDSKPYFLTGNTDTVYSMKFFDLKKTGPMVVEVPPYVLGTIDDHFFRYVVDTGMTGPDKGKGGKYLILPPGSKMKAPKGYFTVTSPTYINWLVLRGFLKDGKTDFAVNLYKKHLKVYPYSKRNNPPKMNYYNQSQMAVNTIHSSNDHFYDELNEVIQYEPIEALNMEDRGLYTAIGIKKGEQFSPTRKRRKMLTEAAYTASVYARGLTYKPRNSDSLVYKDRQWVTGFIGGDYRWLDDNGKGGRYLDARSYFFYNATVNTPAMVLKMVGKGSQYLIGTKDNKGRRFDGSKTYKLRMSRDVPAKNFWSVVLYDPQTRSELQTQRFPSVNNVRGKLKRNKDGSVDLYFGPKAPKGYESNFVKTDPKKDGSLFYDYMVLERNTLIEVGNRMILSL